MNRKIKALGLALIAVLAMSALSAASASATDKYFHFDEGHALITASQVGEDVFTVNAGTVKCKTANYTGTTSGASSTKPFTTQEVRVTPSYANCTAFGFVSTTIDTNGCHYVFVAHKTTPGPVTDNSYVNIECTEGKVIQVTAFNCEVTVGSQENLGTISYTNEGAGATRDVKVGVNLTGIKYTQHSKSFPGCTNGAFANGTYTGSATVKATNTLGTQIGGWYE